MYRTHRTVTLLELADTLPDLNLVVTYGDDGEEDVVVFSVVHASDGEVVEDTRALTHRLVLSHHEGSMATLAKFGMTWQLSSREIVALLVAADDALRHVA